MLMFIILNLSKVTQILLFSFLALFEQDYEIKVLFACKTTISLSNIVVSIGFFYYCVIS